MSYLAFALNQNEANVLYVARTAVSFLKGMFRQRTKNPKWRWNICLPLVVIHMLFRKMLKYKFVKNWKEKIPSRIEHTKSFRLLDHGSR